MASLVQANAWIIPTLVHANAWIVPTLAQANAWIVTTLVQAGAWTVPTVVSSPPFAVIVFRSVSLASRGVCVLLLFSAVSPRRFRAVPPRLCVVPFPRRAAASQLKKQQQRLLEAGRERQ